MFLFNFKNSKNNYLIFQSNPKNFKLKNKYGSFSVPQLEGKSEEYYLIAEDGEVT